MIDESLRSLVRQRAGDCCEYCRIRQDDVFIVPFHVEHFVPRKHGGGDKADNLALACHHCNLHKGTNLTGIDPVSGAITALFRPRTERWSDHFACHGPMIIGLTPTGRVTVQVLNMNAPGRVQLRTELLRLGRS